MDYGHIGCSSDVLEAADWRCSGRRRCRVRVPDAEFAKNKPCPDDLKPYLEAAYVCVPGTTIQLILRDAVLTCAQKLIYRTEQKN